MSREDDVRRVQELRRSSAASPVDRSLTRSQERRLAIQEYNEDGSCKGRCPYGSCGGGPEACGGCCSCMGGCEMANPEPEFFGEPLDLDAIRREERDALDSMREDL